MLKSSNLSWLVCLILLAITLQGAQMASIAESDSESQAKQETTSSAPSTETASESTSLSTDAMTTSATPEESEDDQEDAMPFTIDVTMNLISSLRVNKSSACQAECDSTTECQISFYDAKANASANSVNCFIYNSEPTLNLLAQNLNFYIKASQEASEPKASKACTKCPDGWELFGGICYKTHLELTSWYDARDTCVKEGGVLAMPKNSQQLFYMFDVMNKSISNFGAQAQTYYVWTGVSTNSTFQDFKYMDGTPLSLNNPLWCEGYPEDNDNWQCLEMGPYLGVCMKNFNCLSDVEHGFKVNNMFICQQGC